ncbi:MAG: hypothetical protein JSS32_06245 [Verrucomicrobia bacterium]|nr:hypothetical protein [Verrucomicrobiota bacterium]
MSFPFGFPPNRFNNLFNVISQIARDSDSDHPTIIRLSLLNPFPPSSPANFNAVPSEQGLGMGMFDDFASNGLFENLFGSLRNMSREAREQEIRQHFNIPDSVEDIYGWLRDREVAEKHEAAKAQNRAGGIFLADLFDEKTARLSNEQKAELREKLETFDAGLLHDWAAWSVEKTIDSKVELTKQNTQKFFSADIRALNQLRGLQMQIALYTKLNEDTSSLEALFKKDLGIIVNKLMTNGDFIAAMNLASERIFKKDPSESKQDN